MLLEPVPAMTLIRPAAASTTAAITRSCSGCESVGHSPVVPTGQTHVVPGGDLELDIPLQGLDIDLSVAERGNHGHGKAGEIFTAGRHGRVRGEGGA